MSSSQESFGVKIEGDAGALIQALSSLTGTTEKAAEHFATLATSLTGMAQAAQGTLATGTQAAASLAEQAKAAQDAGEKHQALSEKVEKVGGAFKDLGDSAIKMGTSIRQGTDPLMAVIEQVPAIVGALSSFGPAGMAAGVILTAVGTASYMLVAHLIEVDEKIESISGHMAGVGRGAEGVPPAIRAWSDAVLKEIGGTEERALTLINAITSAMPRASADVQKEAAKVSGAFADMLQIKDDKDVGKLTAAIGTAASGDFATIHALAKEYNLLSAAELDTLEKAEEVGDAHKAGAIFMEGMTNRVGRYTEALRKVREAESKNGGREGALYAPANSWGRDYVQNARAADAARAELVQARRGLTQPDEEALRAREQGKVLLAELSNDLAKQLAIKGSADREYLEMEVRKWQELIATQKLQGNNLEVAQQKLAEAQGRLTRQQGADQQAAARGRQVQEQAATAARAQGEREEQAASAARTQRQRRELDGELACLKDTVKATGEGTEARETALKAELAFIEANYRDRAADARRLEREITATHKAVLNSSIQAAQQELVAQLSKNEKLEDSWKKLLAAQTELYGKDAPGLRKAHEDDADLMAQAAVEEAKKPSKDDKRTTAEREEDRKDVEFRRQMLSLSAADIAAANAREIEAQRDVTLNMLDQFKRRLLAANEDADARAVIEQRFASKVTSVKQTAQDQITQIRRQAIRDEQEKYQQLVTGITKSMGGTIQGLITGTKTVRQAVSEMAKSALSELVGMAEKQANAWIMSNVIKLTSDEDTTAQIKAKSVETATAEINNAAAKGAANAYASASAGPEWWIAPAISAAVQLAIAGLTSSLSSAAGGWGRVPADGMLTELHKDEMVLPASIATPMRSMLAAQKLPALAVPAYAAANLNLPGGGAANANGALGAGGGGTVTLNIQAMDSRDVASFFNRHGDKLVSALRGQKRNFVF
ncbi:hypothetical protein [Nitrospirillum iridis]|uniref:Bacteriophage tail tape measure N-terminal domain-containing protein n=1 Tax=Nitrospirillum iridis TaxID=765888 RepID=A0A7X0AX65_9PROT|nr:hypothetical protein [Nitrospirillum iridis]MBB6251708.1 hypothetical protein [Nitrospirillum iridis]